MAKIRALIIDDSAEIRLLMTEILSRYDDIEVVGTAADAYIAREKIKQLSPDVLTLDIEMPKMTGLQFLQNLMRLRPIPVIMVSRLTAQGAPAILEALDLGAVDFICKPQTNPNRETVKDTISDDKFRQFTEDLVTKVRMASLAKIRPFEINNIAKPVAIENTAFQRVIAIGASTGGTEAIRELLTSVPENCPPILITQHIPRVFSRSFAERLNQQLAMKVVAVQEGMVIQPGCVYLAPGDDHLTIIKSGSRMVCQLGQGERVNRYRTAVDVMFDSICSAYGSQVIAVLLTGMGEDGAKGMLKLKQAGAITYAQDKATSVVWGMPQAAYNMGAVDELSSLAEIATKMINAAQKK